MSWNEPGGNKQDPWGNKNDQGPPDLDELLKKWQNKFNGLFGGGNSNSGNGASGNSGASFPAGAVIAIALAIWLISGFYIIDPAERGVVTQFGRYVSTTNPGPNWHIPYPVQQVQKVNVEQTRTVQLSRESMLTQDENIVDIDLSVQYNIANSEDYLFNVFNPDETVRQVAESAIRQTIGQNKMDVVLTDGRSQIALTTEQEMQQILNEYKTGINILTVNMTSAQPPEAVQAAFVDANRAREDQQRYINQAEAYRNEIIPLAKGKAKQELEKAKGYKTSVIKLAEGETQRFLKILEQYQVAPEVTRERLYIEAIQSVLSSSNKVLIDSKSGNNLLYLPLDKLINSDKSAKAGSNDLSSNSSRFINRVPSQSFVPRKNDSRSRLRGRE